jgi:hypothetical protein
MRRGLGSVLVDLGLQRGALLGEVPGDIGVDVLEHRRQRRLGRAALGVGQGLRDQLASASGVISPRASM